MAEQTGIFARAEKALATARKASLLVGEFVDTGVSIVDPQRAQNRINRRRALARYDAARPSPTRKVSRNHGNGEREAIRDAATLRAQARDMERNYDLVSGALDSLVRNVVGPNGVGISPAPRNRDGEINQQLARDLLNLWKDWTKAPEVTKTMNWGKCQQLACRSWLRDGEVLAQKVMGAAANLNHGTEVALSVELLEADHLPLHYHRDNPNIVAGIERNGWGQPVAYWLYRDHPGDVRATLDIEPRRKPASVMLHLAMRTRISQLRGVCLFAPAMIRIDDIKDYEDSERIAARMASRIAAQVIRDKDMDWTPPEVARQREEGTGRLIPRDFGMLEEGVIFDSLEPGERFELLNPDRPNPNLATFRDGQHRSAAKGFGGISYSTLTGNYNGTYSAQRQELVESWPAYKVLTNEFVAGFVQPVWEEFVNLAVAQRLVVVPSDIDRRTLAEAVFRGPVMPWIDPQKEANALRIQLRAGITSLTRVISDRDGQMTDVLEEIVRERRLAEEKGVQFDSNVAAEKAPVGDPQIIENPEDLKEGARDAA